MLCKYKMDETNKKMIIQEDEIQFSEGEYEESQEKIAK